MQRHTLWSTPMNMMKIKKVWALYYHVIAKENKQYMLSQMEVGKKLEDISRGYHISFDNGDLQEDEDAEILHQNLKNG